jgi:hypothetical protein
VRSEHAADADHQGVAPSRTEVVETGLVAQLIAVDDATGASQQDGEDGSLPRAQRHRSAAASHHGDRIDGS